MTKDKNRIAVSVNVAPLLNDEGDIIGEIEIFQDETNSIADLEFARQIQKSLLPTSLHQSVLNKNADISFNDDVLLLSMEIV